MKTPQLPALAGMTPLGLPARPNASLAQRKADAPLKPKVAQQPRHELGGLFGDEHLQMDLIDAIRSAKP